MTDFIPGKLYRVGYETSENDKAAYLKLQDDVDNLKHRTDKVVKIGPKNKTVVFVKKANGLLDYNTELIFLYEDKLCSCHFQSWIGESIVEIDDD